MENSEFGFHEYDGMVMNRVFAASNLDRLKKTAFHDDDVIVATYPKCGTTWMQQIVLLVLHDGDDRRLGNKPQEEFWQFIEATKGDEPQIDVWASRDPPRLVKSHLSSHFFKKTIDEKKTKFIVVFRNPKDALVSYYHFYVMNKGFHFSGTWDEFFQLFKDKRIVHGDYFEVQLSWWKLRGDPRMLILTYEDMLKSPEEAVKQVAKHLGKELSDEVVQKIAQETSFKAMKDNPLTNYSQSERMRQDISPFMRKGIVGDWKNHFSKEQADYVNSLSSSLFEPEGLYLKDE